MSGTNVWTRSREKLRRFPDILAQCPGELPSYGTNADLSCYVVLTSHTTLYVLQASAYGKCVTATTIGKQELQKDLCVKEFQALKTCFLNAAKKAAK